MAVLIRGLGLFERLESESPDVTVARVARHLEACLADESHSLHVAASMSGDLVGYIAVHWLPYLILMGPEGHVSELFVTPAARGGGIGTALLDLVIDEAAQRGCARLMLEAVRSRESYARGFYPKRGWVERDDMASMVLRIQDVLGAEC